MQSKGLPETRYVATNYVIVEGYANVKREDGIRVFRVNRRGVTRSVTTFLLLTSSLLYVHDAVLYLSRICTIFNHASSGIAA